MRALAALSVVCAHGMTIPLTGTSVGAWVATFASFGMTLFFVLSGFVIHYNYRSIVATGLRGYGEFLWARISRLYPLFLLVLVANFALSLSPYQAAATGSLRDWLFRLESWLPYYLSFTQTWVYLWKGGHSLVFQDSPTLQLTWSISTEFFFYAFYPVALLLVARLTRAKAVFGAIVLWSALWLGLVGEIASHRAAIANWAIDAFGPAAGLDQSVESFVRWLFYFSPYVRFGEFVIGCLTAQLCVTLRDRRMWCDRIGGGLTFLAVLAIASDHYLMFTLRSDFVKGLYLNYGHAPGVALLIFCVVRYDTYLSRCLSARPVVALGEASYSIYLSHVAILGLVEDIPSGVLANAAAIAVSWIRFAVGVPIVVAASLILARYVEVPSRRWLRRQLPQRLVPAPEPVEVQEA